MVSKDIVIARIQTAMKEQKFTLKEVSNRTGIPYRTLQDNINGRRGLSYKNFTKIINVIDLEASFIESPRVQPEGKISGRVIVERLKKATGCKLDRDLAVRLEKDHSTIAAWGARNTIPWQACIQVAVETGISLDELILGKQPANVDQAGRIDVALFDDCWRAACDLGKTIPAIRQLAVRTYNAVQGSGAVGKSLTVPEIAALLLAADSPA